MSNPCDDNAQCQNTFTGNYLCTCNKGFTGDGKTCTQNNQSGMKKGLLVFKSNIDDIIIYHY